MPFNNLAAPSWYDKVAQVDSYLQKPPTQVPIGSRGATPGASIQNADGSESSEHTRSFTFGDKTYLLPTVVPDAQGFLVKLSDEDAVSLYRAGKNPEVGIFNSVEEADAFAGKRSNAGGRHSGMSPGGAEPQQDDWYSNISLGDDAGAVPADYKQSTDWYGKVVDAGKAVVNAPGIRQAIGAREVATSMGTNILGQAIGGALSPIAAADPATREREGGAINAMVSGIEGVSEAMTIQPRSETGQAMMQGIGKGAEWVGNRLLPVREGFEKYAKELGVPTAVAATVWAALATGAEVLGPAKFRPKTKLLDDWAKSALRDMDTPGYKPMTGQTVPMAETNSMVPESPTDLVKKLPGQRGGPKKPDGPVIDADFVESVAQHDGNIARGANALESGQPIPEANPALVKQTEFVPETPVDMDAPIGGRKNAMMDEARKYGDDLMGDDAADLVGSYGSEAATIRGELKEWDRRYEYGENWPPNERELDVMERITGEKWFGDSRDEAVKARYLGPQSKNNQRGSVTVIDDDTKGVNALGNAATRSELDDLADTTALVDASIAREKSVKSTGESGPFPWASERYPALGEPLILWKDKKNHSKGTYIGKASSEESKTFMAERARVVKDMQENGYEPFFPPGDRFDVDVSNYPATENTLIDTLPKKPETAANWREKIQTDQARENIAEAVRVGEEVGGGDRWYYMGQLEKVYIDQLGAKAGRERFKKHFADAMAATTGGADPGGNLLAANFANYMQTKGGPAPTKSYEINSPVGGRYIGGNMTMANKLYDGNALTAAGQPKRHNFSRNFLGDKKASTIDEQMSQGIEGKNAPSAYYASEELVGGRDVQDVAWLGFKAQKEIADGKTPARGKPMIEWVNESIERTSRLTGLTPEEVVKRMIDGKIPMYGLGATAVGAGMLSQPEANEVQDL